MALALDTFVHIPSSQGARFRRRAQRPIERPGSTHVCDCMTYEFLDGPITGHQRTISLPDGARAQSQKPTSSRRKDMSCARLDVSTIAQGSQRYVSGIPATRGVGNLEVRGRAFRERVWTTLDAWSTRAKWDRLPLRVRCSRLS